MLATLFKELKRIINIWLVIQWTNNKYIRIKKTQTIIWLLIFIYISGKNISKEPELYLIFSFFLIKFLNIIVFHVYNISKLKFRSSTVTGSTVGESFLDFSLQKYGFWIKKKIFLVKKRCFFCSKILVFVSLSY